MEEIVDLRIVEEPKKPLAMHPKKFGMWLFMASVMMLFMGLTSAYIVRRAEGNWVYFDMPSAFYYSTFLALIGSVTMQIGFFSAKKDFKTRALVMFISSFVIGLAFLYSQWYGLFVQMVQEGHHFTGGNPSESFFHVFPWMHGAHIVSALIFILITWRSTQKYRSAKENMVQIEMCTTYWHFLGALWLYLFVFLLLYR